jgi:MORN repeat
MAAGAAAVRLQLQIDEKRRKLEIEKEIRDTREYYRCKLRALSDRKEEEKRVRIEAERVQRERIEAERLQREREIRTKTYFDLDGNHRIRLSDTYYYGDATIDATHDAWVAQGEGTLTIDSRAVYKGSYLKGQMAGKGEYYFSNGTDYKGSWSKGAMEGTYF